MVDYKMDRRSFALGHHGPPAFVDIYLQIAEGVRGCLFQRIVLMLCSKALCAFQMSEVFLGCILNILLAESARKVERQRLSFKLLLCDFGYFILDRTGFKYVFHYVTLSGSAF